MIYIFHRLYLLIFRCWMSVFPQKLNYSLLRYLSETATHLTGAGGAPPAKAKARRKERGKSKLLPQVESHFGRDLPDLSTPLMRHLANGDKVCFSHVPQRVVGLLFMYPGLDR
jgi:hypothetical protein